MVTMPDATSGSPVSLWVIALIAVGGSLLVNRAIRTRRLRNRASQSRQTGLIAPAAAGTTAPSADDSVSGFVELLETGERELAQLLMANGLVVTALHGPLPGDVWQLELVRNTIVVTFGIEGGLTDGVTFRHPGIHTDGADDDGARPLGLAWFVWARVHEAPYELTDVDQLWSIDGVGPDVIRILDWLPEADVSVIDAVYAVWHDSQRSDVPTSHWDPAAGVPALEKAVVGG
jgi:hypothetical protein